MNASPFAALSYWLPEADARAASIFFNELDTGFFEGEPHYLQCRTSRLVNPRFKLSNCNDPDF